MPRHLVPVDLSNFAERLPAQHRSLVQQANLLDRFIVQYQNNDSLIKFLMQHCAHKPFIEFIEIAIVLKNLINELHDMTISRRLERMASENYTQGNNFYPVFDVYRTIFLTIAQNFSQLYLYRAEIPFRPGIPQTRQVLSLPLSEIVWQAKSYLIPILPAFAGFYKHSRANGDRMSLLSCFLLATVGNIFAAGDTRSFSLMHPPYVLLNCLAFPPEYRPNASDSPGMAAYKEVLRHIHVILYINNNNDAMLFAGDLRAWLPNRDIQWRNYWVKIPSLILGSVVAAPAIIPLLAFKYQRTKNDFVLYQQTQDLNAPTTNKLPNEALLGLVDLSIFVSASYLAGDVINTYGLIDDNNDPAYNETVRRYLNIYASTVLGFAALIVCHEVTPRATKMLQQVPTTLQNTITSVYRGAANTVNSVHRMINHVWWREQNVVVNENTQLQNNNNNHFRTSH